MCLRTIKPKKQGETLLANKVGLMSFVFLLSLVLIITYNTILYKKLNWLFEKNKIINYYYQPK